MLFHALDEIGIEELQKGLNIVESILEFGGSGLSFSMLFLEIPEFTLLFIELKCKLFELLYLSFVLPRIVINDLE